MSDDAELPQTAACCIVGGGPAGMMLGFLLARAGVGVTVIEKHGDFFRDFRGDTIHPSTLQLMHELGILDAFLKRPHQQAEELVGQVGETKVVIADFRHLPTQCKFIAFMPQWDFLDFIAEAARRHAAFRLLMETEATDLIVDGGRVVGVRAKTPNGPLDLRADLVVAADGRNSTIRAKAGLEVIDLGAPMDVLWMQLTRRESDGGQTLGRVDDGVIFIAINRGDYWQCAYVIPKDGYDAVRRRGLHAFRAEVARLAPGLADRVGEIGSWDKVKLLTVAVDRLPQWHRPGLLLIGDAAHAMSPVGGIGINLAIQDAVAAANILADPLRRRAVTAVELAQVQRRRELPTRLTQRLQLFIQNRIIRTVLGGAKPIGVPLPLRLLQRYPFLRRLPARIIGIGFRPEHIRQ